MFIFFIFSVSSLTFDKNVLTKIISFCKVNLMLLSISKLSFKDSGIFEMDFVLGDSGDSPVEVEIELDVVFKFKNMPGKFLSYKILQ